MRFNTLPLAVALLLFSACSDDAVVEETAAGPSPAPAAADAAADAAPSPPAADGGTSSPPDAGSSRESIAVVTSCTLPEPSTPATMTVVSDLVYASPNGSPQALDVYRPKTPGSPPLVVLVHGGGWSSGDKQGYRQVATRLTKAGYVAASVNYRLVPAEGGNTFPTQISDVRCAVRWLRAHATEHGIDASRVGALGGSAGAHLVAMLGVGDAASGLDDGTCPAELAAQPVSVKAVVGDYTPTDFRDPKVWADNKNGGSGVVDMLGSAIEDAPAVAALASPITHVSASSAPFFLAHGTADTTVPVEQSRTFRTALQGAGGKVTLIELPGVGHGFPAISEQLLPTSCTTLAFLAAYLTP